MLLVLFFLLYAMVLIFVTEKKTFCIAIIVFMSIIYASTEIFSVFCALDHKQLNMLYGLLCVLMFSLVVWKFRKNVTIRIPCQIQNCFQLVKNNKLLIVFILFFIVLLGLAIYTVPYNWDSMTYHLSRIAHWTQNKSVAHYATGDVRQVTSPPLAEFVNLQVYILSGQRDNLFNLLQYASFVTNAGLIYFITKRLGGKKNYCWLSVLLFVSMPIAFAEALTTQVDHFSTMWLLMFIYFLLDILDLNYHLCLNKESICNVIILSSCIAFGYLAKPSILFAMVFFALWLLGVCIYRKDKVGDVLVLIILAVAIICLIILPEVLRNLISFGAISAPIAGARQLIGTLNPVYMIVNGIKNYTMNIPNAYIECTAFVEHIVYWIAYKLGVEINHPSIAEDGRVFFLHSPGQYNHDMAINPVVVIAATLTLIWLVIRRTKKEKWEFAEIYSWISMCAFFVFCLILRWEPYVTRYMLSYLAILCPVIAIWLANMKKRKMAYAAIGIISFLCIVEIPNLFKYHGKICMDQSAEDRCAAYFYTRSQDEEEYVELIQILNEAEFNSLGLYFNGDTYEYPIWAMVEKEVKIETIMVNNETAKYADKNFQPEAIVVIGMDGNNVANYGEKKYQLQYEIEDYISVWELQ